MAQESLALQSHDKTGSVYKALIALFRRPNLQRVRIASAFARWDGLGLISSEVENLLKNGGHFESIFGAGNGITTPDSLLYGLYLKELYPDLVNPLIVEDRFINSIFHPKFYVFEFKVGSVAVVGSANLTGGGLVRNTELAVQLEIAVGSKLEKELHGAWNNLLKLALPVTAKRVREMFAGARAGSESDVREGSRGGTGKPYLSKGPKASPKPLFKKVLGLKSSTKKSKILSKLDTLSEKPLKLYLQIFETETGGSGGNLGYQVQLPVATLATYFGVGTAETRKAEFRFKDETVVTNLIHFENNTHRVRLKPILEIKRPAVLIFTRVSDDVYDVRPAKADRYAAILSSKCTQQSRVGSRRWGFE